MTELIQEFLETFMSRSGADAAGQESDTESEFSLSVRAQGSVVYILLRGELEFHHIESFNSAVDPVLAEPTSKHVVVHMGEVSFVDSTGLACLVTASQIVKERAGNVHLVACKPFIMKTLEITRLRRVFLLHDTFLDAYTAANETTDAA
ncbi:MAG: STAS domain-containing protein [Fibrella sp.]|nr:STAS domain-containing protein [Armatimonadota bacterium]